MLPISRCSRSRPGRRTEPGLQPLPLLALALFLSVLSLAPANAQTPSPTIPIGGESPTVGVRLHAPTLVGRVDASALEVNPAALGLLPAWSAVYHHSEIPSDARVQGRGDALFLAAPLPFYRALAFGAGLQWLRPSDPIGYANYGKLSLSVAWNLGRWFGVGLAYHTFFSDGDPEIDDLHSFDAGLFVRPSEWIALGFATRNLNTPVYDGLEVQRIYDFELTGRPLSTDRLEVGAGLAISERRGEVDPHLRIVGEPIDGLSLIGHVELLRRDFYRDGDSETDVRATLGLAISLERLRVTASTIIARSFEPGNGAMGEYDGAGSAYQGFNISVGASGARQRSILPCKKVLQLTLAGRLSARKWAAVNGLLRRAERDDQVSGVLLSVDGLSLGWGLAQELRQWIARLRKRGKKVYAHLLAPSAREYYAVAAADRVLLSPAGGIRLQGLAAEQLYLRGLFDKVGVKPQFIRLAEYKSAPETFTRRGPSGPAKQVMTALVDDMYGQLVADLATSRRQPEQRLRQRIDEGPFTPDRAKAAGLVDELLHADDVPKKVEREIGGRLVDPAGLRRAPERWPVGPAIAVVVIEGDIVHGKSSTVPLIDRQMTGDETLIETLERVRTDSRVRAVVLRINSPGGSALASERIWRAVRKTAKVKPVIASLGDIAASGGYYAAAGAHRILANPATLTGSIGIFTGKFDLSGLLAKLGLSVDTTERGQHATLDSPFRPYTPEEERFILSRLQYYYRGFLRAVGQGRKMTQDAVHKVARGRVWTGRQAQTQGLVDGPGGLAEAVDEAKRRAGLAADRPVELLVLPRPQRGLIARVIDLAGRAESPSELARIVPPALRAQLRRIPTVTWYANSGEPLARMPWGLAAEVE